MRDAPAEEGPTAASASPSKDSPAEITDAAISQTSDTEHEDYASHEFWIVPIPQSRRYNASQPFHFGLSMNIVFGLASTFTVANLYWCQPLLIDLAESLGTTYENISKVPTLAQAGYGTGLLLVSPLGDLVKRRQLLLLLVLGSGIVTIGLAVTKSVNAFIGLTYIVSLMSVTPQILLPLAADLAPESRRATAMSIVLSGLLLGILVARVIGGIIAEYSSWRNVYYMAIGVQAVTLAMLYWTLPDYPRKSRSLTYFGILTSMAKFAVTEPVLIQGSIMSMMPSAVFSGFWVTLTFLLGSEPYSLNTINIGLFGLVGIAGVAFAPLCGRFIDVYSPWLGVAVGQLIVLLVSAIYAGAAGKSLAVPVIAAFFVDVGNQLQMTANATRILSINPAARARFNAVLIIIVFFGQVLGTQASSTLFLRYGYSAAGGFWAGMMVLAVLIHFTRGPHVPPRKFFGYEGGWNLRRRKKMLTKKDVEAKASDPPEQDSIAMK